MIKALLQKTAAAEAQLARTTFVAPCVRDGAVRARVAGMVRCFRPQPEDFEGWGLFSVRDQRAHLEEEAGPGLVGRYLRLLPRVRLLLLRRLRGESWLAYPANHADVRRRFGRAAPVVVHLVDGGAAFEMIVARHDGGAWWFEDVDRRADPLMGRQLRERLSTMIKPDLIRIAGLTPEARSAYAICHAIREDAEAKRRAKTAEGRLGHALKRCGGLLQDYFDHGDYWVVEWTGPAGRRRTSAIEKSDLTVRSAGVCLAGLDRSFDLQSLVGVMEEAPEWAEE